MLNNTMEEYRNRVIKLHAIYSKIISKSTSNISKHTSKLTSKTDQIKVRGLGGSGRGNTLGRGSYDLQLKHRFEYYETDETNETNETNDEY